MSRFATSFWGVVLTGGVLSTSAVASGQTTYHVAPCGNDAWSGLSPACAAPDGPKASIQAAISVAADGDEVVVTEGTYSGASNKNLNYGGRLITVRCGGDVGACVIDCQGSGRGFVFQNGETGAAVVDGFTITNGSASEGGGMRISGSSPTVTRCTFTNCFGAGGWGGGGILNVSASHSTIVDCQFIGNSTGGGGGGVANALSSGPTIDNCYFEDNSAALGAGVGSVNCGGAAPVIRNCLFVENSAGANGGGMVNISGCSPTVTACTFVGNVADGIGGGMANSGGSAAVTACNFFGNVAKGAGGGGMVNDAGADPVVSNSIFGGNRSIPNDGGAILNIAGSSPTVSNCVIVGNVALGTGGAIFGSGNSPATVVNSILRSNNPDQIDGPAGVNHCNVEGGWAGSTNIDADPLFVDADGPDDVVGTYADNDYRLSAGSPCIDAGENAAVPQGIAADFDGQERFVDDADTPDCQQDPGQCGYCPVVDMGPHEYLGGAIDCSADLDGDGQVDSGDLATLLGAWGPNAEHPADLDGSSVVGSGDLALMLGAWGTCTPCTENINPGSCCVINGTADCNDAACSDAVCATEPACCEVSWDALCAELAVLNCGALCPLILATGCDPQVEGYLGVGPDAYGSWATATIEGGRGDLFTPAGTTQGQEMVFTSGLYLFDAAGGRRELLSDVTQWQQGVAGIDFELDTSLERAITADLALSDTDGDGVFDSAVSSFRVFSPDGVIDLSIGLLQEVASAAPGVAIMTQEYTITNDASGVADLELVRALDPDLFWSGEFTDDVVGTQTNGSPLEFFVYQLEQNDTTVAMTLSSAQGTAYYGGKKGITPAGGPPAYGFGTDSQLWEALGVPASWQNHIAGVGYETNGESGVAPPGCDACDGFVGLQIPLALDPGQTANFTVKHTYGSITPGE